MIRLVVTVSDAGMAAFAAGPVQTSFKTFDVDLPELEKLLRSPQPNNYINAYLSGCELLEAQS